MTLDPWLLGLGLQLRLSSVFFLERIQETIIFELELLAAVVGIAHWYHATSEDLHVWFGDNDASRYASIKADANGDVARAIVSYHLEVETALNTSLWFARVPTEANISDYPSRLCVYPLLSTDLEQNVAAKEVFSKILEHVAAFLAS